jgi:hypothetical protein
MLIYIYLFTFKYQIVEEEIKQLNKTSFYGEKHIHIQSNLVLAFLTPTKTSL